MEFWGVEVKSGETLTVKKPAEGRLVHMSQACVGETKKVTGNDHIHLHAKKGGNKYLIGVLSYDKFPNVNFDLVFEDDFELFHDSKYGSVHLAGYTADIPDRDDGILESGESEEESDEDVPIPIIAKDNGKPDSTQAKADEKPATEASKAKVKIVEPNKDAEQKEGDDSDEDSDSDEETDNANTESEGSDEDSSEGDEADEEESDEETPKKAEVGKKRAAETSGKASTSEKKAKFVTPQKTDGKKTAHVHIATPHPNKQGGKTPANNNDKSKPQTPKPVGGTHVCSSCSRTFGSDQALQSHSKAKHSAVK